MFIEVVPSAKQIDDYKLEKCIAVVFDILRATTTIITALANGCRGVIPVLSVREAQEYLQKPQLISSKAGANNILLAGERGGENIALFQHGNSPLEYPTQTVRNKFLVLTTTNGTRAIRGSAGAARVLIGSLLNLQATAREIKAQNRDLVLVCAGSQDQYSLEDTLGAGLLIQELLPLQPHLSDLAFTALTLAQHCKPLKVFEVSQHGQKLLQLGRKDDLLHAARLNLYPLVAYLERQKIISSPQK